MFLLLLLLLLLLWRALTTDVKLETNQQARI